MIKVFLTLFLTLFICKPGLTEEVKKTTNQEVLKSWQQNNPQALKPELVGNSDGTTQIKWSGQIAPSLYINSVTSSNSTQNSSLREGTFHKTDRKSVV